MVKDEIAQEFSSLADAELERISAVLRMDDSRRFSLFIQVLRQMDYWSAFQLYLPQKSRPKPWDLEILWLGWNRALEYLFPDLKERGFPFHKATTEGSQVAFSLLHNLGCAVLVQRVGDMVCHGYVEATKTKEGWRIKKIGSASDQFLDVLEFSRWERLVTTFKSLGDGQTFNGWTTFKLEQIGQIATKVGRFFGHNGADLFAALEREDIDELMKPLVHPSDLGFGTIIGYDTSPEVDAHFLAKAMRLVIDWRNEAGFHPGVTIDGVSIKDLTIAIAAVVSLHLKHLRFTLIAAKTYPSISLPESLTIWTYRDKLEETIVALTALESRVVEKLVTVMSVRAADISGFAGSSYPFMPLLIDLGNGIMLRPVASISRNPFYSIRALLDGRNRNSRNHLSAPREAWLRSELYAMFQGTRYSCVEGNIKIRHNGVLLTDIDAAVFDYTTGELAIFQIKWQDFSTNNVRELRSRASNLAREMDDWAGRVSGWLERSSRDDIAKSLRLKLRQRKQITSVYLFGISRAVARTQGFGFVIKHPSLAIGSWSQFSRLRTQLGPSSSVFANLHRMLQARMSESVVSLPLPFTVRLSGTAFRFEDLWSAFDDEEDDFPPGGADMTHQ